jgi:hypothetical protein
MAAVPDGSYLVISHPASDIQAAAMAGMATRLNQLMAQRVKPRNFDEVTAFFGGLDLVDPGVVPILAWHPEGVPPGAPNAAYYYGAMGRKP